MRRQTFHGATVYVSNVVDARLQHAQYHAADGHRQRSRSEEHTSELQSHSDLVCRLLLEKKMKIPTVAVTDTNADPDLVTYPIAGNDDAIRAIRVILQKLVYAIYTATHEANNTGAVCLAAVAE